MRLFVACSIPDDIKRRLDDTAVRIRAPGLKWVESRNLHITLKFIGEADMALSREVDIALAALSGTHEAFSLSIKGIGRFGSPGSLRVLWAGIDKGASLLERLAIGVDERLGRLGVKREARGFSPHITLARACQGAPTSAVWDEAKPFAGEEFGSFTVSGFSLMQSDLRPSGPVYREVSRYVLADPGELSVV